MANEDQQPRVSNKIKGWTAGLVTLATLATAALTFSAEVLDYFGSSSATDRASEPQPTAVQVSPGTPGDIFNDDFADDSGKWPREEFNDGTGFDYADGGYRIYDVISAGSREALVSSAGTHEDVIVEVDATITEPPGDRAWWGVVCRALNPHNLYRMGISNDGSTYISMLKDGNVTDLAAGGPSDVVRTGIATNHIRGECVGGNLTLYVNGQKLLEAKDTVFVSGYVGLSLATWEDEPGTNVMFDNFLVSSPRE